MQMPQATLDTSTLKLLFGRPPEAAPGDPFRADPADAFGQLETIGPAAAFDRPGVAVAPEPTDPLERSRGKEQELRDRGAQQRRIQELRLGAAFEEDSFSAADYQRRLDEALVDYHQG